MLRGLLSKKLLSILAILLVLAILMQQFSPTPSNHNGRGLFSSYMNQQPIRYNNANNYSGESISTLILRNNTLLGGSYYNSLNSVGPEGISLDNLTGTLYVAAGTSKTIACLNSTTMKVEDSIDVNSSPYAIMYDAQNSCLYVIDSFFSELYIIQPSTNQLMGTIKLGSNASVNASLQNGPSEFIFKPMDYDPANGEIIVTNYFSGIDTIINGNDNKVIGQLFVGNSTKNVIFDRISGCFYETYANGVAVIDPTSNSIVDNFTNITSQHGVMAVNPINGNIYVSDSSLGSISIINVRNNSVVEDYVPSFGTSSISYDSTLNELILVGDYTNSLTIVNPANRAVVAAINTGNSPLDCCVSPSSGTVFITNYVDNSVMKIDPSSKSIVSTAYIGTFPLKGVYQNSTGTLYISAGTQLLLLNTTSNTVYSSIPIPEGALGIALDPVIQMLYLTGPSDITIINATTDKEANIIQNVDPLGVVYDPSNGYVYVSTSTGIIFFHHSATPGGMMDKNLNFHQSALNNIAFDKYTNAIVVSSGLNMTFINTSNQQYERVDMKAGDLGVMYPVSGSVIIVCSSQSDYAYVINTTEMKEQKALWLGGIASSMTLNAQNGYIYSITNNGICVINKVNETVIYSFLSGTSLNGSVYVSHNSSLYVMDPIQGVVYILMVKKTTYNPYYAITGFIAALSVIAAGMLLSSRRRNKKKNS